MKGGQLYTIPSDRPFAQELVRGVMAQTGGDPAVLSRYLILLPTRRACRAVRDTFLSETGGKPLLLPRLQPLGDIDAEELYLSASSIELDIPPAIAPARRLLLLARLIAAREGGSWRAERHIPLARALARLMDQIYTEDLSLDDLPRLVDGTDFADHWQITVDFLNILASHWPDILAAEGVIDPADRRSRLMNALAAHWERTPPAYPVIAAGSTGSIPATARLLTIIAGLPSGAVILPGLDRIMNDVAWEQIGEGHPQATLKSLLQRMGRTREGVRLWHTDGHAPSSRLKLASEIMRPAAGAESWQAMHWHKTDIQNAIQGLSLIEADSAEDEAEQIALLLRETLETPEKTALVITPDRTLAARIVAAMRAWGVQLDDSAGQPLIHTPAVQFFLLLADMTASGLKPALLLAVLKHHLCCPLFSARFTGKLETRLLRGLTPPPGPDGLIGWFQQKLADDKPRLKPDTEFEKDLNKLSDILSPFYLLLSNNRISVDQVLTTHIGLTETFVGADNAWRGDDGQALAAFLADLHAHIRDMPPIEARDYPILLRELMRGQTIRPAYGTHPRLSVMGQLEARLIQADRVILAGLNEGTWPPDAGTDPFLSRPMKKDFGLPPPERAVGLSAHDFVQAFCGGDVILTRSKKADGAPALPARWLYRLETVLAALGQPMSALTNHQPAAWQAHLYDVPDIKAVNRPAPRPDPAIRPAKLSVTQIETWVKDPYSIYAKEILRLRKLDPLEQEPDAAARGTLIHAILETFVARTGQQREMPAHAATLFLDIAKAELPRHIPSTADQALLWPRIVRLSDWFIEQESIWRGIAMPALREVYGKWAIKTGTGSFTLSGIADRIDMMDDGTVALIDYKSGGASMYTSGGMASGKLPQLPLEALMLRERAFGESLPNRTGTLAYWIASGGRKPGEVKVLNDEAAIDQAVSLVEGALYDLIRAYEKPETPYFALPVLSRAPRYNDYAHLSRVQEWTALDESEEAA